MTKVFVAAGVVLSALPLGVVLWARDRGPGPSQPIEENSAPTATMESQPISAPSPSSHEQSEPSYTKLNVEFAWVPYDGPARMGYHDRDAKAFYAWKGVVIPAEQIPGIDSWFQGLPLNIRALKVTEVDPPPTYYMPLPDGGFAPGFYAGRENPHFYRWKGIRLKKEQIPADAVKKYVLPDGWVKYPHVIDPPQSAASEVRREPIGFWCIESRTADKTLGERGRQPGKNVLCPKGGMP